MNRSGLWFCALAAAASAAPLSGACAFSLHGPGGSGFAHLTAGPELHAPGPPIVRPAPAPPGNYNFSGNSFNLSVTRNGRPPVPPPMLMPNGAPPMAIPNGVPAPMAMPNGAPPPMAMPGGPPPPMPMMGPSHPGFIQRFFNWW